MAVAPDLRSQDALFQRADADADGVINLTDSVFTLRYLFLGGVVPPCEDAADTTDDGVIDLTDAVSTLNALFLGGPLPAPPNECGADPTDDALGCQSFPPCPLPPIGDPTFEITEFVADNSRGLRDGNGQFSDWIEVTNTGAGPADLAGYHLTDDLDDLTRWTFPENPQTRLEPGASIVVFASGQDDPDFIDRRDNLHTTFQLDSSGESIALVDPNGQTIVSRFGPGVPDQRTDVSYGRSAPGPLSVFLVDDGDDARFLVGSEPPARWSSPEFDDASWLEGRQPLGFETEERGLFRGKHRKNVEDEMHGQSASLFVRHSFEVDDPTAIESLTLWVRYDDGFSRFTQWG